jgi:hypothetical protein
MSRYRVGDFCFETRQAGEMDLYRWRKRILLVVFGVSSRKWDRKPETGRTDRAIVRPQSDLFANDLVNSSPSSTNLLYTQLTIELD